MSNRPGTAVHPDEGGFTLIELLVVIIILGVLSAVVVFAVRGAGDKGQAAARITDVKTLRTAEEAYCAKNGTYGTEDQLVSAKLLSEASTLNDIELSSGGPCGTATSGSSAFSLAQSDASMVIGTPADTFNVTNANKSNLGMFPYNANIFETLYRMTPDFQIQPWLAASSERLANNNSSYPGTLATYRFHLQHGVLFHDGHELQAPDVVWSMNRLAVGTPTNALKVGTQSTVAVAGDAWAVDITPTVTNERLLDQLVHPSVAPIVANNTQPATSATTVNPDGTGPYRFASYTQSAKLVVTRNDTYWNAGEKPRLKTLTFKFYTDSNARVLGLKAGDVDFIYDVPKDSLASVGATSGLKTAVAPPAASEVLWLNSYGYNPSFTKLTDSNVRKAVAAAIDRSGVVNTVWPAGAQLASTVTPAALLGSYASTVTGPTYNQTVARNLLDDNGYTCAGGAPGAHTPCGAGEVRVKSGSTLTLALLNGFTPVDLRTPSDTLVQSQLQAVGIGVNLTVVANQGQYDSALASGSSDIFMERISQNDASPVFFGNGFFYGGPGFNPATGGLYNKLVWGGTTFDGLLDQARLATDRDVAKSYTAQAMHEAVDNQVTVVQLAAVNWLFGMKTDVQSFLLTSARHVRWAPVYRASS